MTKLVEQGYTITVNLPVRVKNIIMELVERGDYRNIEDFVVEATRGHLQTWYYEKFFEREKQKE